LPPPTITQILLGFQLHFKNDKFEAVELNKPFASHYHIYGNDIDIVLNPFFSVFRNKKWPSLLGMIYSPISIL